MISRYGLYLPLPIVATLLAFVYGVNIRRGLASAAITLVLTMLGGMIYQAIGQVVGVCLSALIIFIAFTLPEQRRLAREEAERAREARQLPNEEDM